MERIKEISDQLHEKDVNYSKLSWVQFTTGIDFGVDEGYKALSDVLVDKGHYNSIQEVLKSDLEELDRRKVELLHHEFEPFHKSDEINALQIELEQKVVALSQILNTHRIVFEGRETTSVEIAQILANEEDRERRKAAYFAKNQVNKPLVEGGFIELVNMRKELAKLNGNKDFVELKLNESELDPSIFDTWKEEVQALLPKMKEVRKAYAQKYLNDDQIMPWDEAYISAKLAPALNATVDMSKYYENIQAFFLKFGIDISQYNITYDVFPRANKSEWGYNFPIETGVDSRILANVKDKYTEYNVLLHETGHGIHSFLLNPDERLLNMGVSGIISEGIANLFGGFVYDEMFYGNFFNKEEVTEAFDEVKEWNKINAFRAVHRILFDQAFYREDVQSLEDIYDLYWKLYKDVLDEEPFGEEPPWAFLIHHTTHPIYLHNYFMGDVTCEMLKKVFNEKHGTASITEKPLAFGEFLKNEVVEVSGRYRYQELFQRISGEAFSLKYLL